jgi:dsRNA-specific ribonuclease
LNELKQAGVLLNTGYELVSQEGTSHQPVFSIMAWAATADQRWTTEPVRAPSKKAGQRAAAESLLRLLADHGITRF